MEEIEAHHASFATPVFLAAMERAAENIRAFHARQKQQSRIDPERNSVLMGHACAACTASASMCRAVRRRTRPPC